MGIKNSKKTELEAELEETISALKNAESVEVPQVTGAPKPKAASAGVQEKQKGPKSNFYGQEKLVKYAKDQIERRGLKRLPISADAGDAFILLNAKRCGTKGEIKRVLREETIKRA